MVLGREHRLLRKRYHNRDIAYYMRLGTDTEIDPKAHYRRAQRPGRDDWSMAPEF